MTRSKTLKLAQADSTLTFIAMRPLLAGAFLLITGNSAAGQDIVIDWSRKTLDRSPQEVSQIRRARIEVKNVNNILYSYRVVVTATPRVGQDFETFVNILKKAGGLVEVGAAGTAKAACEIEYERLKSIVVETAAFVDANRALSPKKIGDTYPSVPLQETLDAWSRVEARIDSLVPQRKRVEDAMQSTMSTCPPIVKEQIDDFLRNDYSVIQSRARVLAQAVVSEHVVRDTVELKPDNDYTVKVEEYYGSSITSEGTKEFKFKPLSNVLTLSLGPLFSTARSPLYEQRKVPVGDTATTQLVVQNGSGLRVGGVALLNYVLPVGRLSGDSVGVTLSAGPSFRLSSGENNVSRFGFFGGGSLYLWRRIFLTAGVHVTEFADFPAGFYPGREIPANFGELNPVKRVTAKFGFALTFKVKDFGAVTNNAQSSSGSSGGKSPETPKTDAAKPQ